jgi:hypothetical protein
LEEHDKKVIKQMGIIKEKYQKVDKVIGIPEEIYKYLNTDKNNTYVWKVEKKILINNVIVDNSKFGSLLMDYRDKIDFKKYFLKEVSETEKSDLIIDVYMVLSTTGIEDTPFPKYEYIYTYNLIKNGRIVAQSIYKYTKIVFQYPYANNEVYVIYNNWE